MFQRWLNTPGSPFANQTMMTNTVEACMDTANGNMLDAIGIAEQIASFTNVSFGDTSSLDIEGLDFSSINTMVTEVNALSTMSVYDFDADATVAINALNSAISNGDQSTTTQCVR
jgi:hypothetical protein